MKNMKKERKKVLLIITSILLFVLIVAFVNFIPTWNLETKNMTTVEGEWCNVYYEQEQSAALDVFELADNQH